MVLMVFTWLGTVWERTILSKDVWEARESVMWGWEVGVEEFL